MTNFDKQIKNLIIQFIQLDFDLETDDKGQIVIYTGMKFDEKDQIIPMKDDEE